MFVTISFARYETRPISVAKISTLFLSYVVPVKNKVEISQNCVAFSEYINFNWEFTIFQIDKT